MKVLICHERYEPDFAGGGEIVVHQTALHLARLGLDVRVITTGDPDITSVDGIPTHRLPVNRYRFNLAVGRITEMARSADIIHTFNYHACLPALAAGHRLGKPVVCSILGQFMDEWLHMRGPIVGRLFRAWEHYLLCRPYTSIGFFSKFSRQLAVAQGVDAARTFIAAPGIDTRRFKPAETKNDTVLYAGKLNPRKGIEELVAVARALPAVQFEVIGWDSHPCTGPLYNMANVRMIPFDRDENLSRAFARARLFFFPTRAEPYGLVVAEAMASGCAIISTVDLEYEGVKVKPYDVEGMVRAISTLWRDRDRSTAMGRVNAERAASMTWERYAGIVHAQYREILARAE